MSSFASFDPSPLVTHTITEEGNCLPMEHSEAANPMSSSRFASSVLENVDTVSPVASSATSAVNSSKRLPLWARPKVSSTSLTRRLQSSRP